MVSKHSLLKYFTLTFTRHKSSKFEGLGPPLSFGLTLCSPRLSRRARTTFSSARTMRAISTFSILKFEKICTTHFPSTTWTSSNRKLKKFRPRYLETKLLESRTSYEIRTFESRTVLESLFRWHCVGPGISPCHPLHVFPILGLFEMFWRRSSLLQLWTNNDVKDVY